MNVRDGSYVSTNEHLLLKSCVSVYAQNLNIFKVNYVWSL